VRERRLHRPVERWDAATAPAGGDARHPLLHLQATAGNAATTDLVVSRRAQSKEDAQAKVDGHVEPKPCFVWFEGNAKGWGPMPGTGCAHWISHQLGITRGLGCDLGKSVRVRDVIKGMDPVVLAKVEVGDIWRSTQVASHAGIVRETIEGDTDRVVAVVVEHDSVRQKGVVTERMTTGKFFRPS
jgi:hypothetical protein